MTNHHVEYEPARAVRTLQWSYIRRFDDRRQPCLPNCDAGPVKSYLLDHGWSQQPQAEESLFDLTFDPMEVANITDERAGPILDEMRHRLRAAMAAAQDPLLT